MMTKSIKKQPTDVLRDIKELRPVFWSNPRVEAGNAALKKFKLDFPDMKAAAARFERFAPFFKKVFPQLHDDTIESPLYPASFFRRQFEFEYGCRVQGKVLIKCDSHLPVAGSIKARGGFHAVFMLAEELLQKHGMIPEDQSYAVLKENQFRRFFNQYEIIAGSTGNLGLSIGIMGTALGFQTTVIMSSDAKEWKKNLLRKKGVHIIEQRGDVSSAYSEGRKRASESSGKFFIDDETSEALFLGYSVAALRLGPQLKEAGITKDAPMHVYLPCGVGGAPAGLAFGLKHIYGEQVKCFFVEPTHSPSMLLGLLTNRYHDLHVSDFGIDNQTIADGLAVGTPSKLTSPLAEKLADGFFTVEDAEMLRLLALLQDTEKIRVETSAASSLAGIGRNPYATDQTVHLCWLTGGKLLPDEEYATLYKQGADLLRRHKRSNPLADFTEDPYN